MDGPVRGLSPLGTALLSGTSIRKCQVELRRALAGHGQREWPRTMDLALAAALMLGLMTLVEMGTEATGMQGILLV